MKHLNWKNDASVAWAMVAQASRGVGGKYRISRHEGPDGVWFEVEHLVNLIPGASGRYAGCWDTRLVQHQPVARTYAEAFAVAEADNDQRRAIKDRNAA